MKIHKAQAIGHLHLLWWWTLDFSPTGELSAFTSCEIAGAAEWTGDEDGFVGALKETGWLEEDGRLHDWHDYAGRLIEERDWKRKRDREYQRERRQRIAGDSPTNRGATVPNPTLPNPTEPNTSPPATPPQVDPRDEEEARTVHDVIAYLNEKAGRNFKAVEAHARMIRGRLAEGFTPDDFKRVIDNKVAGWKDDPKMADYLRPETLFRPSHFQSYLNERPSNAPRPGEPGYVLTDLDRVIVGFKKARGIPPEDKAWNREMFDKQRPHAKSLLDYFGGDWERAVDCIAATAEKCATLPSWGWTAVMNHAPDFKNGGTR